PFIQSTPANTFYIRNRHACNDPEGLSVMRNLYPQFPLTPQEKTTPWGDMQGHAINAPIRALSPEVRQEIIEIKKHYSPEIIKLDALNFRNIFQKAGLSQGAIDLLGNLSPLIGDFYYNSSTELLGEVYSLDFNVLYRIDGGTSNLPLALFNSFFDAN